MIDAVVWFVQQLFRAFPNIFWALARPGDWLSWVGGLETDEAKASLARFIHHGASTEFFFAILAGLVVLTGLGLWRGPIMWGAVRILETVGNGAGRLFAWAGLVMVLQQILIVFLQRIFRVSEISLGPFGYIFTKDLSWYSEELKIYNAMIVCLCVGYTFIQSGHVRVDILYSAARHGTKRVIDMAGSLLFMLPVAGLVWFYSWFFMWRHLVTPKVSASDTLTLLERKARFLKWNVETIGFSPNGFNGYFLFKVLIVVFAALVFIQGIAFFYRSFMEWREGEDASGKYLDKDHLDDAPAEKTGLAEAAAARRELGEAEEMLFGLDGVEVGLIVVFLCLFGGIMSGFPVAFAIGGSAVISFGLVAALDGAGLLVHQAVNFDSPEVAALVADGVAREAISLFKYPDLPIIEKPVFEGGWEKALDRNLSFVVNRMNERVIAGQSIETLLAVLMFVMMGITLERSRIANDLLTTMARVFGPLPGGLAVSVVVVGAFLAASTGIVGATVVTMGLLSLPTMLRNKYSPELATGVISASGTLGQIIPPSIVIVLLGTLAGDIYATAQEDRARMVGCSDALTYLGEAAVVSVGTLFQAAILPGILLAGLYAAYAFGFALFNPSKAPPVRGDGDGVEGVITRNEALTWFLIAPAALIAAVVVAWNANVIGGQNVVVSSFSEATRSASLRTNVSDSCREAMVELHGPAAWDKAVAEQAAIEEAGGIEISRKLTEDELAGARAAAIEAAAPVGSGVCVFFTILALVLLLGRGIRPGLDGRPIWVGLGGCALAILVDSVAVGPLTTSGVSFALLAAPAAMALYGARVAVQRLGGNELVRVVFPPLVLIVAVLGSILGGITNPTPAAALGAGGAIMLAAFRKLRDENKAGNMILTAAFAVTVMILLGVNFDLRVEREIIAFEEWIAILVALAAYHVAIFGVIYACWTLFRTGVLSPVVRETAKVTSMVFTILIGSQLLNLVVISFGGEEYIQDFLRSFEREWVVFLIVMIILFILGFVLDFLEIIYIVIPIVGPVIYGGTMDPKWVTIMIAVNLQTSFLTPPFGFALFYLRGVAPPEVTTGHIYRGVAPFVLIQVAGLALLALFPGIVTVVPSMFPR